MTNSSARHDSRTSHLNPCAIPDALAKLLIDKGIITQQEFMAKLSAERRFAKGFWCCGKSGRKSTVELKQSSLRTTATKLWIANFQLTRPSN